MSKCSIWTIRHLVTATIISTKYKHVTSLSLLFLRKLEVLDLSHNQMAVVPSHLPRALRQLSLQHNHIHAIPPNSLSHLRPGLQSLHLSHNILEEERVLGKSFRGVYQTLVELLLDNNRFETVPRNIRYFKNLQLLRLDHNRIRFVHLNCVLSLHTA